LSAADPILEVEDLRVSFPAGSSTIRAVDGVSFSLETGKTLGLVGESGCGKSVTAMSILRLVGPPGRVECGRIVFKGQNLTQLADWELRRFRGAHIAMVFQEPMTALNPVLDVGSQIAEALLAHPEVAGVSRREARDRAIEAMRDVAIPDAARRARDYPHQLSGGMRQRVTIAMALICNPELLIADEPTTALDVTIQAQILDLLAELRTRHNLSMILISHDLGVVAETVDTVAVMLRGKIVETGAIDDTFRNPVHPYTRELLAAVPRIGSSKGRQRA
jgi:ABC-type dipeptide/oligopeptide/nickel transport system ATPase component